MMVRVKFTNHKNAIIRDSVDDALNVVDGGDENEVLIIFEVSPDVTEA